jgi:hypothetical protein
MEKKKKTKEKEKKERKRRKKGFPFLDVATSMAKDLASYISPPPNVR